MNFDLKTLGVDGAVTEKCDLLVLLVSESFVPGSDALSDLVTQALKAKDFEAKPGKHWQM